MCYRDRYATRVFGSKWSSEGKPVMFTNVGNVGGLAIDTGCTDSFGDYIFKNKDLCKERRGRCCIAGFDAEKFAKMTSSRLGDKTRVLPSVMSRLHVWYMSMKSFVLGAYHLVTCIHSRKSVGIGFTTT